MSSGNWWQERLKIFVTTFESFAKPINPVKRASRTYSGVRLQSGFGRVYVLLVGDDLVIELLQLGFLLLLHADGHGVVLLHHQSHHLLVLRPHGRLALRELVLDNRRVEAERERECLDYTGSHGDKLLKTPYLYRVVGQLQLGHQVLDVL